MFQILESISARSTKIRLRPTGGQMQQQSIIFFKYYYRIPHCLFPPLPLHISVSGVTTSGYSEIFDTIAADHCQGKSFPKNTSSNTEYNSFILPCCSGRKENLFSDLGMWKSWHVCHCEAGSKAVCHWGAHRAPLKRQHCLICKQ